VALMIVGALLILGLVTTHLRRLVDFVTTLAFLSALPFAYLNHRVVRSLPPGARPSTGLCWLSWMGLVYLVGFSVLFVVTRR